MADAIPKSPITTRAWYDTFKTNKITSDYVLGLPTFDTDEELNENIPDETGLAYKGGYLYGYDGTKWVKIANESDISASTFRADTLNDL